MTSHRLGNVTITSSNEKEYFELKREIFTDHTYYFECEKSDPIIIDAGAHIGMTTLYFKKLYPASSVTAIEAHPDTFKILEENMWQNGLTDVTRINAALTAEPLSTATLHADEQGTWLSTASLHPGAWNGRQKTQPLTVPARRLSEFLQEPIDLLKLDVEGVELALLKEAAAHLHHVKMMLCEFHPTPTQSKREIIEFLEQNRFKIELEKQQLSPSQVTFMITAINRKK